MVVGVAGIAGRGGRVTSGAEGMDGNGGRVTFGRAEVAGNGRRVDGFVRVGACIWGRVAGICGRVVGIGWLAADEVAGNGLDGNGGIVDCGGFGTAGIGGKLSFGIGGKAA